MSKKLVLFTCIVMVLGAIASTAPCQETGTIILLPEHTCRARMSAPDDNQSTSYIVVRVGGNDATRSYKSWLKFDVSGIDVKSLASATLTLTLIHDRNAFQFDISYINDDCLDNIDWTTEDLTWNNAPANDIDHEFALDPDKTTFISRVDNPTGHLTGEAFTMDVLEALKSDTDGIVQLVLHNSSAYLKIASLTHAEEAWRPFLTLTGGSRTSASDPNPDDAETDVSQRPVLSWAPGTHADQHDVYFGTSFDDVNDATKASPEYKTTKPLGDESYAHGLLDFGMTYYWRIDEVNDAHPDKLWKGSVWSVTVEPFAYPITSENITAIASSQAEDQGPENTVNESGLVDDLHSTETTDMWATIDGEALPAWIQYEFDKTYKLHEMLVWNYNGPSFLAKLGLQDVTVEYSTDGVNWTLNDSISVFNEAPGTEDYGANTTVPFGGVAVKYVKITVNSNWIGELFKQYGLSEVRFFYLPVWAKEPSPVSGAEDVGVDVTLSWLSGREAATHDVYLSTDEQAVIDGTVTAISVVDTSYSPDLDLDSTYYWRIDEFNEVEIPAIWQGEIWSFATADHIVVDNFESYNGLNLDDPQSNRIFITWKDGVGYGTQDSPPYSPGNGTGSIIGHDEVPFVEQTIVRSGKQSMPYFYNNSGSAGKARYSEVEVNVSDLKIDPDWTKGGVEVLSLYFHGDPDNNVNTADRIYVALKDGLGHLASVSYPGDLSEMKEAWWHKWVIELKEFENAGVDLTNITSIYLGVGNRVAPQAGASGVLIFDDIRLLPSSPAPILPEPEPINQIPVAHWGLDEGTGTFVGDSAGGHTGTVMGGVGTIWVAGKKGTHALQFNGEDNHYVDCGTFNPAAGTNELTCAVWAKWDGSTNNWQGLVCKRDTWAVDGMMWQIELNQGTDLLGVFMHEGGRLYTPEPLLMSEWQHVAFTIDNANNSVLYIDGQAVATSTTFQLGTGTSAHLLIGATFYQNGTGQDCFNGALDDVYLFNDALTQGQIITLMDP